MKRIGKMKLWFSMNRSAILILLIGLLLLNHIVYAAEEKTSVEALVEQTEWSLGDTIPVTIRVSSEESIDVRPPRVPKLEGFDLVNSSTSESVSQKLVQGARGMEFQTRRTTDYVFVFQVNKKGKIQIPVFEVFINGKPRYTKPIVLDVSEANAQGQNRGQGRTRPGQGGNQNWPFDDDPLEEADQLFQQLLQRRGFGGGIPPGGGAQGGGQGGGQGGPPTGKTFVPKNPNEAFLIHADVDKSEVYEGEQITASWYIMAKASILSLDRTKFPDLKGFWKEVIEEVTTLNFGTEVINGITYRKAMLASYALFPIKPGTATIDEYKLKANIAGSSGPFGAFGVGPSYVINRASERVNIKVKPLPTQGKPNNFSGAVGNFNVTAKLDGQTFFTNQPFSLKVRFEGEGNAKLIDLPQFQAPAGIEVYDTKSESKFFKNGKSFKEFEILLIPREKGKVVLPAMSFGFFNPDQGKYYERLTEPLAIDIQQGKETAAANSTRAKTGENKKEEVIIEKNELPAPIVNSKSKLLGDVDWKIGLGFNLFVVVGLIGKAFRLFRTEPKSVKLKRLLKVRLEKVNKILKSSDYKIAATQTLNMIYAIFGEAIGKRGGEAEMSKLLEEAPPSINHQFGAELKKIVEDIQLICFAPDKAISEGKAESELKLTVDRVDKLLRKIIDSSELA